MPSPKLSSTVFPRYWLRLLPVLAALALLTHLPSFLRPIWNPDEGFLATQARMLADGGQMYLTVVDRKPPLLPWTYQALFALFGDGSLWPVRALAVMAHLLTAVLLVVIARGRWGGRAGVVAGVLYLLLSIGLAPEDTQAATFEVFMLPFTAAAFLCADRRRWALAGAATAVAALTKQVGGAVLLPVVWALWRQRDRRGALWLTAGFLLPLGAVALVTGPGRLVFWTVTSNGSYTLVGGSWLIVIGRALGNAAVLGAASAAVIAALAHPVGRLRNQAEVGLWLWLASGGVAVVTGFHFFGHYYLQLVPPLALLGAGALNRLPSWRRPVLVGTAVLSAGFLTWGFLAPSGELDHARRVAGAVSRGSAPKERVLIWGMHPEVYWLARREPASRYLTAGLLTNFSGGRDHSEVAPKYGVPGTWEIFQRELAERPPGLIVDDSRGAPYSPSRIPALGRVLERDYRRVGEVDGTVLYARVTR